MRSYFAPLALLVSSLFLPSIQAETKLFVGTSSNKDAQIQITYPSTIRIEQAVQDGLTQIQNNNQTAKSEVVPIYWLGAALLDIHNTVALETKREQVLTQLADMGQKADNSNYISKLVPLAQFLRQIRVGQRIMQPLDVDLIRIAEGYNSRLDGQFLLILPPRPTTVTVLGAVAKTGDITWQSQTSSKDYLEQAGLLEGAENAFVWIIQPDGNAIRQPIAYWNYQAQDIAPGATLYVEFSNLFDDYSVLNENIVELLRNRTL